MAASGQCKPSSAKPEQAGTFINLYSLKKNIESNFLWQTVHLYNRVSPYIHNGAEFFLVSIFQCLSMEL